MKKNSQESIRMNVNCLNESSASPGSFAAWIGMDWGDRSHALRLAPGTGEKLEKEELANSPEALHGWFRKLEKRFEARPVALALEASRGALLHVFAQYPWLTVYPVNPATSAWYRKAFAVSGAKDDGPDAEVLLELGRLQTHRLKAWQPEEDEGIRRIDALTRARRDAVDRRTQCLNQMTSLLKTYYPQALELTGGDLSAAVALDFLERWPDLLAVKAARPATIRAFYYQHNVRRPAAVEKRVEQIAKAVALTTDEVVVSVARMELKLLAGLARTFNRSIAEFDRQIAAAFKAHPDAELFRELPGAGPALAPRLLAAFGSDRTRYADAASLQKYAGIAPVREKSGGQLWTHWRWQAPDFLRQTFVEWAGQTVMRSQWARCYYERKKRGGKKHHSILRSLAFKWIRILWKCWQDRTPYNEEAYLDALKRRKSPDFPWPQVAELKK